LLLLLDHIARSSLGVAADPNIQLPLVSVSVFLDGASPEDASRLIARPLETRLRSVPGVKELSSSARLSYARIVAEFEVGYSIDTALRDIKQAVEEVKFELPREAEDPQIREYSFAMFPVMNLSLIGSASLRQKVFIAREFKINWSLSAKYLQQILRESSRSSCWNHRQIQNGNLWNHPKSTL